MVEGIIFPVGCAVGPRSVGSMTEGMGLGMADAESTRRMYAACIEVSNVSWENQSGEYVPPRLGTRKVWENADQWYKASDLRFVGIRAHLLTLAVV